MAFPRSPVEVACDESGSEGDKLVGGNTDVFAHASVVVGVDEAAEAVRDIRGRIRSPATEYKANHLLRAKHRAVLTWFLGPDGPLVAAHVYLVDKPFLAVTSVVDGVDAAAELYRAGRTGADPVRWWAFLEAANELGRVRSADPDPVKTFLRAVDALGLAAAARESIVEPMNQADVSLDPLPPAIVRTVEHWSDGGRSVRVVHDQTNALTPDRLAELDRRLGPKRLASLTMVDSVDDPRVQLADFLAGVARKIAENALNGHPDRELTTALRPYVDANSVWADTESWDALVSE
ncbi:DUF3800 domain-containing protein [Jiangella asiatica]|uniref:DUF3800 domain-containing protein n=1 Tax=Jiangella asiatica TaxID=2530372 RepID=A0A4R5CBC4_9ACTN|nr:DUF3800 domain-containing protein [Jiangella asiatica]TDD97251.1 DUF3800 domain-containing protein [Jiangella asiatica]